MNDSAPKDMSCGRSQTFLHYESGCSSQAERRAESLREEQIPVDAPIDFVTLRHKADAVTASQNSNFKLYQIEVSFRSATLRIEQADFRYFRPAPPRGGPSTRWEQIIVHVSTPRTVGGSRKYVNPGRIMGERSEFSDPRPEPAPANIVSPDEAVRRFTSAPIASPTGSGRVTTRARDTWTLRMQLFRVGATYSAGLPPLNPSWRLVLSQPRPTRECRSEPRPHRGPRTHAHSGSEEPDESRTCHRGAIEVALPVVGVPGTPVVVAAGGVLRAAGRAVPKTSRAARRSEASRAS